MAGGGQFHAGKVIFISDRHEQSATMDEYIRSFPPEIRKILEEMRAVIRDEAPEAEEAIRYGMPTFRLHGKNLVHFAAFRHHIGFYPIPSAVEAFREELSPYKQGKGSVQFPPERPVPYDLVREIVRFRVAEIGEAVKGPGHRGPGHAGSR